MSEGVSSVVGKLTVENMSEQIFASKETVFVLVTAPADVCPSCSDVLREFESLSTKHSSSPAIFLAADAFANEFDDWILADFPQLFAFVADRKEEGGGSQVRSKSELSRLIKT